MHCEITLQIMQALALGQSKDKLSLVAHLSTAAKSLLRKAGLGFHKAFSFSTPCQACRLTIVRLKKVPNLSKGVSLRAPKSASLQQGPGSGQFGRSDRSKPVYGHKCDGAALWPTRCLLLLHSPRHHRSCWRTRHRATHQSKHLHLILFPGVSGTAF